MGSIKPGETVCIFGAGPVGLMAMRSAWLMGAGRVIAVDRLEYRLARARSFGDAETLNYEENGNAEVVGRLKELTDGLGPDVCIDAVGCEAQGSRLQGILGAMKLQAGSATALTWSIQAVRRGGNVVIIGVYGPPWNLVPIGEAMNKGVTIRAAQCNVRRYMPHLLKLIRQGVLDPKAIISHRLPLTDAAYAYRIFEKKQDECVKCVLLPQAA
jgi:threonine dehydrogenase-like Zn-dependent dehydrogenase